MIAGSMSGTRQHGQRKEEEHIAQASQSHMAAREQPRAHPLKQKKCRALQISEESAQAVDVYNLQSPGLVLQDLSLVSLTQNTSTMLWQVFACAACCPSLVYMARMQWVTKCGGRMCGLTLPCDCMSCSLSPAL